MDQKFDYVIVGGGIAGLACAELLSRSGYKVAIIEKAPKLCSEASASHHGWFHFGSLYSIFPENHTLRTLIRGIEDLTSVYGDFENMNIRVGKSGALIFPDNDRGWVRDEPLEYIVCSRNDPDFNLKTFEGVKSYIKKVFFLLTWEIAIKQFISRHMRFMSFDWSGDQVASKWIPKAGIGDYSREVIEKPNYVDLNLDKSTHFKVQGYDRPMRSQVIVLDLIRSFLGSGGVIAVNQKVDRIQGDSGDKIVTTEEGESFKCNKVIISAGKWLSDFDHNPKATRVMASPLLVVYPAVTPKNFVRMVPFLDKTINHIHHDINGIRYSVIGGGDFADPADEADIFRVTENLKIKAEEVFPKLGDCEVVSSYLGYKTEVVSSLKERNYQYRISEEDNGEFKIVPGKFTLCFSLACSLYAKLHGHIPKSDLRLAPVEEALQFVGDSHHGKIVMDQLKTRD